MYAYFTAIIMRRIGMHTPTLTATAARSQLYQLIADVSHSHLPVHITSKKANAVLVSEEDWLAIQETLYLVNIPGMRESILEGMKTPLNKCQQKLKW